MNGMRKGYELDILHAKLTKGATNMSKPLVTTGDKSCIVCPHCNHRIPHPAKGEEIEFPRIVLFDKLCPVCEQQVHFQASWQLVVKASTARSF